MYGEFVILMHVTGAQVNQHIAPNPAGGGRCLPLISTLLPTVGTRPVLVILVWSNPPPPVPVYCHEWQVGVVV